VITVKCSDERGLLGARTGAAHPRRDPPPGVPTGQPRKRSAGTLAANRWLPARGRAVV